MAGSITESNGLHGITKRLGIVSGYHGETLTGALTLDGTYPNFLGLDPGGASRNVTLPDVTGLNGMMYLIANKADAAENLVIKNAAGDTIATANQNEAAYIVCNGSVWYSPFVFTIAQT